jgi:hypothetical protein
MKFRLGVVLLAASCTRQTVVVYPTVLANQAAELAQRGSATVYGTNDKPARIAATDKVDVLVADGDLQRPLHLSIRELVANCETDLNAPNCLASHTSGAPITIDHGYHFNGPQLATGITFSAIAGGFAGCLIACEGASELRSDLAVGGLVIVATAGVLLIILATGGRD